MPFLPSRVFSFRLVVLEKQRYIIFLVFTNGSGYGIMETKRNEPRLRMETDRRRGTFRKSEMPRRESGRRRKALWSIC